MSPSLHLHLSPIRRSPSPHPETSARRDKPAGKTKAIERHRPGRVRMGLGLIGLGLKTLITGKTK